MRVSGLSAALRRVSDPLGLALVLLVVVWWWYTLAIQGAPGWAFDFRQFWQGAHDVVNGVSPYPDPATLARIGAGLDLTHWQAIFRFPYPAPAAVVLAPLALVGFHTAAAIWSALLIASFFGTLWILGVRDWRVLAVVVTSAPVVSSVRIGYVHADPRPARRDRVALARPPVGQRRVDRTGDLVQDLPLADGRLARRNATLCGRGRGRGARGRDHARGVGGDRVPRVRRVSGAGPQARRRLRAGRAVARGARRPPRPVPVRRRERSRGSWVCRCSHALWCWPGEARTSGRRSRWRSSPRSR